MEIVPNVTQRLIAFTHSANSEYAATYMTGLVGGVIIRFSDPLAAIIKVISTVWDQPIRAGVLGHLLARYLVDQLKVLGKSDEEAVRQWCIDKLMPKIFKIGESFTMKNIEAIKNFIDQELRELLHPNIWISIMVANVMDARAKNPYVRITVPDVRNIDEARMVKAMGFIIVETDEIEGYKPDYVIALEGKNAADDQYEIDELLRLLGEKTSSFNKFNPFTF